MLLLIFYFKYSTDPKQQEARLRPRPPRSGPPIRGCEVSQRANTAVEMNLPKCYSYSLVQRIKNYTKSWVVWPLSVSPDFKEITDTIKLRTKSVKGWPASDKLKSTMAVNMNDVCWKCPWWRVTRCHDSSFKLKNQILYELVQIVQKT